MKKLEQWLTEIKFLFKDEGFMKMIHFLENIVSKILSLALIVVIIVSLFDLLYILMIHFMNNQPAFFLDKALIEIFGLFLHLLIALELLENITSYIRKHIVQVELVLVTALIAVARKIIIFDTNKYESNDLVALGIATLCLAGSYWLVKRMNCKDK
jgi:uncharacterized membrane protein (DUF373 family)